MSDPFEDDRPVLEGYTVTRGAGVWIARSNWALSERGHWPPIELRGRTQEELIEAREQYYGQELAALRELIGCRPWLIAGIGT